MGKNSEPTNGGGGASKSMTPAGECCTSDDEEPTGGNYRNGSWPTVSKDSLVACRPGSTFQMTKMTKRKKK